MLEQSLRPDGMLLLGAADALQRTVRVATPGREPLARPRARPRRPTADRWQRPADPRPPRAPQREQRLAAALAAAGKGDRDGARD